MRRAHIGTILFAVLLIAVGAVLIGIHFLGWEPYWFAGWWTLPLMALAVVSLIVHKPNFFNCMMLGSGLLLFARLQDELTHMTWRQFWGAETALAFVLAGVFLLVRMLRPRPVPPAPAAGVFYGAPPSAEPFQGTYTAPDGETAVPASGETFPARFALFTSENCRSDCRQLKGGRFTAIFGGVRADLRQADFAQPISIEANSLFGGIDIITPPGVRVECTGTSVFGGCDAKAITGRPYDPAHPVLTIRYLNIFGGTNVK